MIWSRKYRFRLLIIYPSIHSIMNIGSMSVVMCQAVFWEIVEVNKTGKIMDSHGTYLSGVIAETDKKKSSQFF